MPESKGGDLSLISPEGAPEMKCSRLRLFDSRRGCCPRCFWLGCTTICKGWRASMWQMSFEMSCGVIVASYCLNESVVRGLHHLFDGVIREPRLFRLAMTPRT